MLPQPVVVNLFSTRQVLPKCNACEMLMDIIKCITLCFSRLLRNAVLLVGKSPPAAEAAVILRDLLRGWKRRAFRAVVRETSCSAACWLGVHRMKLNHLETFQAVIAGRSFSAAARGLGLTQPAVSLQIRRLEKEVGLRLVERIGKQALPTAAGADFLEFAQRVTCETREAIRHMREHGQGRLGRVRIGTGATACTYLLPTVLKILRQTHPNVKITVITGNSSEMLDAVESNILDLAVVTLPARRRTLLVQGFVDDPLVAIFPKGQTVPATTVRPQTISGQPLIVYESGGTVHGIINHWFSSSGVEVRAAMEVGSVEATKRFVAVGLGCSIIPSMAVAGGLDRQHLSIYPLTPKLSRKLGLVLRHDKILDSPLRAALRAFDEARRRYQI